MLEVVVPGLPPLDWAQRAGRAYVTQSSLFLEANGETDWLCAPSGGGNDAGGAGSGSGAQLSARPLGFRAPGTFAFSAKASIEGARSAGDAPALLVWRTGALRACWAKLAFERWPGPAGRCGPVTAVNHGAASAASPGASGGASGGASTAGTSDLAAHGTGEGSACWLRICRTAPDSFAFHASWDGQRWDLCREFRLAGEGEVRAGFLAQCPQGSGCECRFEEIRLGQPPRDIRDGT